MESGVPAAQKHAQKPHVVAIPFPICGHIFPMLQLCKTFAASGFTITFVNTERNHALVTKCLLQQQDERLDIRLIAIPDAPPTGIQRKLLEGPHRLIAIAEDLKYGFEPLIDRFSSLDSPLACILSDVHLDWTQDVADKFRIPRVAFWSSVAAECQLYFHAPKLIAKGHLPFEAPEKRPIDGYNRFTSNGLPFSVPTDKVSVSIPGLPKLQRQDFPAFFQINDPSHVLFQFYVDTTKRISEADAVLFNSCMEQEAEVFDAMGAEVSVVPVGPLLFRPDDKIDSSQKARERNLSPEERRCMTWLDAQDPSSVLYVALGSLLCPPPAQIASLAMALESCQQPFLWALLPDPASVPLPEGFLDRTKDRSLVVGWAPQSLILAHPSVGGYLNHSGWNSCLESIFMGVPMLCCPLFGDHYLISKLLEEEWKVAFRIPLEENGVVPKSEEVARLARELLQGEGGKEARRRVVAMRGAARKAIERGGSSSKNLEAFMDSLRSRPQGLD